MNAKQFKPAFGEKLITPKGRLSFPHLLEKNSGGQYSSDKYEVTLLIPKDADIKPLQKAALDVARKSWGEKVKSLKDIEHPFRDGDEKEFDGYAGHWYIKPRSKNRPGIVDAKRQRVEDDEEVYGGRFAKLSVVPFTYLQAGRMGVSFQLQNVQLLEGGERFGKRSNPEDDFAVEEGDIGTDEAAELSF